MAWLKSYLTIREAQRKLKESQLAAPNVLFIYDNQSFYSQEKIDVCELKKQILNICNKHGVQGLLFVLSSFSFDIDAAFELTFFLKSKKITYDVLFNEKLGSFGTVLALGAKRIFEGSCGALSPIDPTFPSHGFPLGRSPQGQHWHINPLEINPFKKFLRLHLKSSSEESLREFIELEQTFFPDSLVMAAENRMSELKAQLLEVFDESVSSENKKRITDFLVEGLGSFDGSLYRTEQQELGLNIFFPTDSLSKKLDQFLVELVNRNQGTCKESQEFLPLIQKIEEDLGSTVFFLFCPVSKEFTGEFNHCAEAMISNQLLVKRLKLGLNPQDKLQKVSIILSSAGGNIPTMMNISKLLKENFSKIEVLTPENAFSSATLFSLLQPEWFVTENTKITPFDPLVNNLLRPNSRFARVKDLEQLLDSVDSLDEQIKSLKALFTQFDPFSFAQAHRSREFIKGQVNKSLENRTLTEETRKNILELFLLNVKEHLEPISINKLSDIGFPITKSSSELEVLLSNILRKAEKRSIPLSIEELNKKMNTSEISLFQFRIVSELVCSSEIMDLFVFDSRIVSPNIFNGLQNEGISYQYSLKYYLREMM